MIYTDREWLRFVTFALVAGATLGVAYTTALGLAGHPPAFAAGAGIAGTGLLALVVHVAVRWLLDAAATPPSTDTEPTDDSEAEA